MTPWADGRAPHEQTRVLAVSLAGALAKHTSYGHHVALAYELLGDFEELGRLLAALDEARAELTAARERAGRFAHDANLADDRCDRLEALANKHYARAEKAEGEQAYTYGIARKAHARAEAAESARSRVEALAERAGRKGYDLDPDEVLEALATPTTPDATTTQGEAMTTTFADRRTSDHDCTTDTHCCSDCQTHDGCSCKQPTTPEETQP